MSKKNVKSLPDHFVFYEHTFAISIGDIQYATMGEKNIVPVSIYINGYYKQLKCAFLKVMSENDAFRDLIFNCAVESVLAEPIKSQKDKSKKS